jgi:hypothetical protein
MTSPPALLPSRSPIAAIVLGWLIPGGGHAYGGQWGKAILFFSLICALMAAGMVIGGGTVILHYRLWFGAQLCAGGPTMALLPISQYFAASAPIDWANRFNEMGTLYTAVAGLLNLLVVMDAYLRLAHPQRSKENA